MPARDLLRLALAGLFALAFPVGTASAGQSADEAASVDETVEESASTEEIAEEAADDDEIAEGSTSGGEIAVEVMGGYLGLSASKSADAVFDSSGGFTWGAAGRYSFKTGTLKSFFVTAGVRTFSKDGERVFVAGPADPVARLGFPLSVRITPIFLTAGYRFRDGKMVVPYAGIGGSLTSFSEHSSVAGVAYDESRTKAGFHVVGGAEVGRGRFRFGGEVSWSTVPDAIGLAGVSRVYGESNLGGWTVLGKVVIALGGKKAPDELEDDPEDDPGEEDESEDELPVEADDPSS